MAFLSFIPVGIPASSRLVYRPVYPQVVVPPTPDEGGPTGGKGDNPSATRGDARRRRGQYPPVKPLGLPLVARRVPVVDEPEEPREQEAREGVTPYVEPLPPISAMTQEEIIAEISMRMRAGLEVENYNRMMLLLLAASE